MVRTKRATHHREGSGREDGQDEERRGPCGRLRADPPKGAGGHGDEPRLSERLELARSAAYTGDPPASNRRATPFGRAPSSFPVWWMGRLQPCMVGGPDATHHVADRGGSPSVTEFSRGRWARCHPPATIGIVCRLGPCSTCSGLLCRTEDKLRVRQALSRYSEDLGIIG
jgi:hypothetical protein